MVAGERDAIEGDSAPGRRARDRAKESARSRQLSLFDAELTEELAPPAEIKLQAPVKPIAARPALNRAGARVIDERPSRVLCVGDMPAYSDEAHESVAAALEALPPSQLWFTYKDIQGLFGVSRATVARRLREGLVPGVRMAGSSVMEDAAVRRFDRVQLKWLLLALRHRPRQPAGRL
ncbi:hypothetical protein [Vitreimonas flagellata]|jgi:hypothetical protein|uniref:hypothetical protein n=1 Tax=Vitreimonas flagellata TaxID=2560861 RepID=UPI001074A4F2|nr:hypothetical protein [Vitreimonas flagellata]